jgi:hypothetical protein
MFRETKHQDGTPIRNIPALMPRAVQPHIRDVDLSVRKDMLGRISRDVGAMTRGGDRLAFEARIWRAVLTRAPSLSAAETVALTEQIVSACDQAYEQPRARRSRRAPLAAV